MIPQTHAGTHAPAWPGGGAGPSRPSRNWPCGPKPPDRGRGAWHVADIDIDMSMARARGPEREKKRTSPSDPDAAGLGFQ